MNKKGTLKVLRSSDHTFAQDLGRRGGQHIGVCESGACDQYAFTWANKLLNNPINTPVIEITLGPFSGEFSEPTTIALCGADMNARINDCPIHNWGTFKIQPGDTLNLGYARSGLRCYLAVTGGFLFGEKKFSSIASVPREKLGFNNGESIAPGLDIFYKAKTPPLTFNRIVPWRFIPDYDQALTLAVYPSYQHSLFSKSAQTVFTSNEYTIQSSSNRMGYRTKGEKVIYTGQDILSEGIAYGSVQIPGDGQPIILLNDRPTIGGYPKIGCVMRRDCYQLAQRRPGQKIHFFWKNL